LGENEKEEGCIGNHHQPYHHPSGRAQSMTVFLFQVERGLSGIGGQIFG